MKRYQVRLISPFFWTVYGIALLTLLAAATQGFSTGPGMDRITRSFFGGLILPSILSYILFGTAKWKAYLKEKKKNVIIRNGIITLLSVTAISEVVLIVLLRPAVFFQSGLSITYEVFIVIFIVSFIVTIFRLIITGFLLWFDEVKEKEALQAKQHEMELELVKARIDPHFLFNSINNIDALILKDSERASEYLNKLSELLRYILYKGRSEFVPLEQEVSAIEQYIALQKIRTENLNYVTYEVEGNLSEMSIPGGLFLPVIENAFKYATTKENTRSIIIKVQVQNDRVNFECSNQYETKNRTLNEDKLGVKLLRERLKLIYGENYLLEIENSGGQYRLVMKLNKV